MTFPDIPADTLNDAAILMAGPAASRAAVYTAEAQIARTLVAIRQAHRGSANCDICGHFHPLTEHPVNTHSYAAVPKLERESGGARDAVWTVKGKARGDVRGVVTGHDHAMCDPDRDCGPDYDNEPDEYPIYVGGNRAGKTFRAEQISMARARRQAGPSLASFFKDASPAAEAEAAAMRRMHEAEDLKNSLRWTTAEALRPATDAINRIGESLAFPGGRMWAEHAADEPNTPLEDHPVPGCCPEEAAMPAAASPEDKLRIIAAIVDSQAPLGSDLANFKRRLALILDMP